MVMQAIQPALRGATEVFADFCARFGDVLTCPKTGGALRPTADDTGLESGAGRVAAVRDGTIDFVNPTRDDRGEDRGFAYQWKHILRGRLEDAVVYNNTAEQLRQGLCDMLDLAPADWKGLRVVDCGSGHGQYCRVLADMGAQALGCDLSEVAYRCNLENRQRSEPRDATFVRCDALAFPVRPQSFDVVLSMGMAMCTPDTRRAVMSGAQSVKPGGRMLMYIYEPGAVGYVNMRERFPLPRALGRTGLRHFCKTAAIPLSFYLAGRHGRLPSRQTMHTAYLGLFDAYSPDLQRTHTAEECMSWLREAGLTDVRRLYPCFFSARRPG